MHHHRRQLSSLRIVYKLALTQYVGRFSAAACSARNEAMKKMMGLELLLLAASAGTKACALQHGHDDVLRPGIWSWACGYASYKGRTRLAFERRSASTRCSTRLHLGCVAGST